MSKNKITELSYSFLDAIDAYMNYEKSTHQLKTKDGKELYQAEIHLISEISDNVGIHVTALAEKINVTTGAVSQVLRKLEKKGLIKKEKDPLNLSRYLLSLTKDGGEIHHKHLSYHEDFDSLLSGLFDDDEKIEIVNDFFLKLMNELKK